MMSLKATFSTGSDSTTVRGLYQWDIGQILEIESADIGSEIVEIHFACPNMNEAIVYPCTFANGVGSVTIPDVCLEQSSPITAWIYRATKTRGYYTSKTITLPITARTRPGVKRDIPATVSDKYTELITQVNEALGKLESGEVVVAQATNATTASHATSAGNAATANYATSAGNANTAHSAKGAVQAETANKATNATYAVKADKADKATTANNLEVMPQSVSFIDAGNGKTVANVELEVGMTYALEWLAGSAVITVRKVDPGASNSISVSSNCPIVTQNSDGGFTVHTGHYVFIYHKQAEGSAETSCFYMKMVLGDDITDFYPEAGDIMRVIPLAKQI